MKTSSTEYGGKGAYAPHDFSYYLLSYTVTGRLTTYITWQKKKKNAITTALRVEIQLGIILFKFVQNIKKLCGRAYYI